MLRIEVQEIARHRNGCFGEPFHAVRFTSNGESLVAAVFDQEGRVAVFQPGLATSTVAFGVNSYRGDWYEPALREAIQRYEEADAAPIRAHPMLRVVK